MSCTSGAGSKSCPWMSSRSSSPAQHLRILLVMIMKHMEALSTARHLMPPGSFRECWAEYCQPQHSHKNEHGLLPHVPTLHSSCHERAVMGSLSKEASTPDGDDGLQRDAHKLHIECAHLIEDHACNIWVRRGCSQGQCGSSEEDPPLKNYPLRGSCRWGPFAGPLWIAFLDEPQEKGLQDAAEGETLRGPSR